MIADAGLAGIDVEITDLAKSALVENFLLVGYTT